jgi:hypothetical protein
MDFYKMMRASDTRLYTENKDYILTPDKKVRLNYSLTGQFDIHYWKRPTVITNATATTYEFEVAEDVQSLIPYYMGGWAVMEDKPNIGTMLLNQYNLLKGGLKNIQTDTEEVILDTYNW